MKLLLWLAVILSACGLASRPRPSAPAASASPLDVRVQFSSFANLTFELDCLTDHTICHQDDYRALWNRELLRTDEDRRMLASWKAIRNRYATSYELADDGPASIEPPTASVDVGSRIAIAGLQSRDLDDYLAHLDLLVLPRDRVRFHAVVRHFQPRFDAWWAREAGPRGAAFVRATEALLASPVMGEHLRRFIAFYAPEMPRGRTMAIDLLYRPGLVHENSSGRQLDAHLLVEFFAEDEPASRADVVFHELCHFLFASRSTATQLAFQQRMLAAGSPITVPAFNLLDEGLATAFGGTVRRSQITPDRWAKYLATPRSMYNKPNIDLAGKTLLPIVDEWMASGKTLDDPSFVARYLEAMTHAFGARLASPAMRLVQLVLVIDDSLGEDLRLDVRRAIGAASTYTEIAPLATADLSTFTSLPNTSALLVIPRRALPHLVTHKLATADQVRAMERATQGGHGILYAIDRNPVATTYIVVADTPSTAKQQIERLAAAPALFTGLLE